MKIVLLAVHRGISQAIRWTWKNVVGLSKYRLVHFSRWELYPPIFTLVVYWCWSSLYPILPGYCIAALALVAAIMTIRADKFEARERVIWVFLAASLMFAETRVVYLDRDKQDREHNLQMSVQNQHFAETVLGLEKTINLGQKQILIGRKQFDTTVRRIDGVLATTNTVALIAQKNLKEITGGDSFAYLWPDFSSEDYVPLWKIHNSGSQILTGVTVKISYVISGELAFPIPSSTLFVSQSSTIVGVLPPLWGEVLPMTYSAPPVRLNLGDAASYLVLITAQNGGATEFINFRPSMIGHGWDYRFDVYMAPTRPMKPDDIKGKKRISQKVMSRDWTAPGQTKIEQ